MADLPIQLDEPLADRLLGALDVEGKIVRSLAALGPLADRDVALVGGGPIRAAQLAGAGARVRPADWADRRLPLDDAAVDVIVGWWSAFRGVHSHELAEVDRALRPNGRLLVVHDYGRDDVALLRGDQPEYGAWSRRGGPYLAGGFRLRVVHCWWTFGDLAAAREFLGAAFGEAGEAIGARLSRPRLSYNVAIYHRTRPSVDAAETRAASLATGS